MATPVFTAPQRLDIARRVGDPRIPLDPAAAAHLGGKLSAAEIERAEPDIDFLGIMGDPKARTDPAIFDAAVGSLGVLGYGRPWLARKLGLPAVSLAPGQRRILPYRMRLVLTAAIRIGSRWATPESTGQTAEQIGSVQRQALSLRFRPPAAYGNRYEPETAAVLPRPADAPLTRSPEEMAAAKVQMLAYFCEYGGTAADLAHLFGISARSVGCARNEEMGLRMDVHSSHTMLGGGQEDAVAEIVKAANAVGAGEDPREVYGRLRAYAAARKERRAASEAA